MGERIMYRTSASKSRPSPGWAKTRLWTEKPLLHLGLSPQEQAKPPPLREILRVAEYGEGWGVPASWAE